MRRYSIFKWVEGRQGTGYRVLTLFFSKKWKRDCYLIHYQEGSSIPPHKDPCEVGFIHKRVNIVLPTFCIGGKFRTWNGDDWVEGVPLIKIGNFAVYSFYPSEVEHRVSKIVQGSRWVLSFGRLIKRD